MSQLRKEYKEFKQFQEDIFKEAAEAWTEENVILINERLNRNAIYRLNSAIQRFDNKFGKYRDQLPAIANILNNAENGLQLVITGKVGSRTTAHMLQRMSVIYNILSSFFGGDLGALLKTPAFRVAHEQPDEKIDKIVDHGHNVKSIRRNLAAALKPSDEERIIFRKAYKTFEMPTLDWNEAAKQLCCLSCNELKDLAGIEKVPMVVVDEEESKPSEIEIGMDEANIGQSLAGAYNTGSRAVSRTWNAAGKAAIPAAGAAVGGAVGLGIAGVQGLANRFKSRSKEMTAAITKLEQYVKGVDGFESIQNALGQLREKSKSAAQAKFDLSGGVRGLLRHPSVVVMKQAVMATEAIESVIKAWNEHIKDTYNNGIKPDDLPKLKKELNSRIKGSVLSKIKGAITGVKPFPGLSSDDIINAVMNVASKDVNTAGAGTQGTPTGSGAQESIIVESINKRNKTLVELHQMVSELMLTEDYADLEKLITQIGTFEKSKEGNAETNVEKDLQSANKSSTTSAAPKTPAAPGTNQTKAVETTNVKPITNPQQARGAAQQLAQEAEVTAQQDPGFNSEDLEILNDSITILNNSLRYPLNGDLLNSVNAQIAALQVPGVSDYNSARDFITQYQSIITEPTLQNTQKAVAMVMATIKKYAEQPRPTQSPASGAIAESKTNRRQILVEKIKQIILEQLKEEEEISDAERAAALAAPPARGAPVAAPAATAAPAAAPVAAAPVAAPAATAFAAVDPSPVVIPQQQQELLSVVELEQSKIPMIDDNVVNQFNASITSLNKLETLTKLNVKAAIDQKLSTSGIQNVTDLSSFQGYFKKYQNIMKNAKNIRKIMSIINKTANVVRRTAAPSVATPSPAPATGGGGALR